MIFLPPFDSFFKHIAFCRLYSTFVARKKVLKTKKKRQLVYPRESITTLK
jgi:hypothetical protein